MCNVIRPFSRSHRTKNHQFWPELRIAGLLLQFEVTYYFEMMHNAWRSVEEVPYFLKVIHQIPMLQDLKITRPVPAIKPPDLPCYLMELTV